MRKSEVKYMLHLEEIDTDWTFCLKGLAFQWSGALYSNMIISLKVFLFLVLFKKL